jgi:hypothetical protein
MLLLRMFEMQEGVADVGEADGHAMFVELAVGTNLEMGEGVVGSSVG